ncbi:hypothetical protein UlMin_033840 [Ulmus minor]
MTSPGNSCSASKERITRPQSPSSTLCPTLSPSHISELQMVFNYFDQDGDGKISPSELQNCVRAAGGELSAEEAEAAIACSDTDGDGLLGLEEFEKLMQESSEDEEEKKKEMREAFGMYEMKGSGCITASSLRRMLSRLGESRSLDDCKAMITSFDLNGDGVLSFDEFLLMMR